MSDLFGGELPELINKIDLARFLNLSELRITQLVQSGMKQEVNGSFIFKDAVNWYIETWRTKKKVSANELEKHKIDLTKEQFRKVKIENDLKMGDLINLYEISKVIQGVSVIIANQLDALAPRLSNELTNQKKSSVIKEIIKNETRAIRESIAIEFENFKLSETGSGDSTTTEN